MFHYVHYSGTDVNEILYIVKSFYDCVELDKIQTRFVKILVYGTN